MSRGRTGDGVPYKTALLAGLSGSSLTADLMPTAGGEQRLGSTADTQPSGLATAELPTRSTRSVGCQGGTARL